MRVRPPFRRDSLREDSIAGLVLGVQSVPDGLAVGILAAVNPVSGLYAYMFGTFTGALFTSSAFMAVQATGAMSIVVADVPAVHEAPEPASALFTLSLLTGAVMLAAGFMRLGSVLRFVSNAVMVGFISAVGVNIVLGQLANFTGYASTGTNRVARALDTLLHPGGFHLQTVTVGVVTVAAILLLERTRLGAMSLVVAIVATSSVAVLLGWNSVATLGDLGSVPQSLPRPELPSLGLVPVLVVPALSLAFIGLVQGAGISTSFVNPDGRYPDASQDFIGQGAANIAAGIFQGMPVGGSVSATSINKQAGARSRQSLLIAAVVMAAVVLCFADAVARIAMPALAGLLMLVGLRTIKLAQIQTVWRTGLLQKVVLATTFVLTMIIPLQYAVLVGVGLTVVLHVVRQSNQVTIRRWLLDANGDIVETDPPAVMPAGEVVVLQPYGSLFFAAAPVFEAALPEVTDSSRRSVLILRLRGRSDLGTTFMQTLARRAVALEAVDSKLVIVSASERIQEQLEATGVLDTIGRQNMYGTDERVGASLRQAHLDAVEWIEEQPAAD